jgi:hypothetical protein
MKWILPEFGSDNICPGRVGQRSKTALPSKFMTRSLATIAMMTLIGGVTTAHAVQVQTDFTWAHETSHPSTGFNTELSSTSIGPSYRVRFEFDLMTRNERHFQLLVGPYLRYPLLFTLSGYGTNLSGPNAMEVGIDIGFDWFAFARTFLTAAPSWDLKFRTSAVPFGGPAEREVEFSYHHWSVGIRGEVPILTLESEPGDRRVEFGALLSWQVDRIQNFEITPLDFEPTVNTGLYRHEISGTQLIGSRWVLGAFMNFRL